MNEELLVFAHWCRPETLNFDHYCQVLHRLQAGESLFQGSYLDEFPEFSFIRNHSIEEMREQILEIRAWQKRGVRILLPMDSDYPREFFQMEDSPKLIYFWGHDDCLDLPKLSIVGSREPSRFSTMWVEDEVGKTLDKLPVAIVSGGARGVDQAAHGAAIRKRRPTLVFVPSGFFELYPQNLKDWIEPVLDGGGAFVSEYPPQVSIRRHHFVARNRLIAAISLATLIVEARARSGTLLTARAALEQGRPVFVVPTHPYDGNGRGGLDLIADGATLIRDAQDLLAFCRAELRIRNIDTKNDSNSLLSEASQTIPSQLRLWLDYR